MLLQLHVNDSVLSTNFHRSAPVSLAAAVPSSRLLLIPLNTTALVQYVLPKLLQPGPHLHLWLCGSRQARLLHRLLSSTRTAAHGMPEGQEGDQLLP